MPATLTSELLALFGYAADDLDERLAPARINAGAEHAVLFLRSRALLSAMQYDLARGRELMNREGFVTVLLAFCESEQMFHTRNPFASGGVYEDPATGAATAALAGYLRDLQWPHGGRITVIQGEDMGSRSLLTAEFSGVKGSSIRVSGTVRAIDRE